MHWSQIILLEYNNNNDNNNNNNNNNDNNNNKRLIPTLVVANASLPVAGSNGLLYCVEEQKPKSDSYIVRRSNSGFWTGVMVTLIGRLCGTDPYSFMKEHVISIEEVSC